MTKFSVIPKAIEAQLSELQSRSNQAVAILECASYVLAAGGGPADLGEGARLMCTIDGAIRILKPINCLGDNIALRRPAQVAHG